MKSKKRPGVVNASAQVKQRVNVRMAQETCQRLQLHSLMSGKTPGEILDDLVTKHCRDWKVQANVSVRAVVIDRLDLAHSDNLSAQVA